MLTALFGIEDGGLSLAINMLILILVVIWIALIYWTYSDARRRIEDPVLVSIATAASLVPFIGTFVYSILRPPEFIEDRRERELETRAAELRLRRLSLTSCPRCEHAIELSWLRCPECQQRLKDPCRSCGRPVDPRWAICPHCETAVAASRSSREGQRRGKRQPQGSSQRPPGQRSGTPRSPAAQPAQARSTSSRPAGPSRSPAEQGSGTRPPSGARAPQAKRGNPAQGPEEGAKRPPQGERPRRKPTTQT